MANRISKDGLLLGFQPMKQLSKYSDIEKKRQYLRLKKRPVIRGRELRYPRVGMDADEQRAAQNIEGSILERIVYKKLQEILGPEGVAWVSQRGIGGGRVFKGGYVLDFVVEQPRRVAVEVQGAFWHGANVEWKDAFRALAVMADGYEYVELLEWEIRAGDQFLEETMRRKIGLY